VWRRRKERGKRGRRKRERGGEFFFLFEIGKTRNASLDGI
jgi:hypothetical protein